MRMVRLIAFIFLLFNTIIGTCQNNIPLLDRKVSVNFSNVTLKEALFKLSEIADFNLSFNSSIIQSESIINFNCKDKKLSEIFPHLIPTEIIIKTSGNNVILLKKSVKELKKKDLIIEGKVIDLSSGKPINNATILDIYGSQSVLTDSLGNFKLGFTHKPLDFVLSVSKIGYKDTSVLLISESQSVIFYLQKIDKSNEIKFVKIEISPIKTVETYPLSVLMIPELLITHSENIEGYSNTKFQLSLTPGTSTNLKIAGTVKNDISINLIGGYNYGVAFFELGGVFNINRTDVKGLQIAGMTNLVGGEVNGLQIAGVLNRTKGAQHGMQVAGFGNFNSDDFSGFQLSTGSNLAKNVKGLQIAGGVNLADSLSGIQVSTIYNKSTYLEGLQLCSGLNVCDTLNGVQIGLINRAKQQNGFQLGIININDSSKGLSIGIIIFVKDKKFPRILFAYK